MSLVAYASTVYGMIYGFTPVTRRNRDEFATFVYATTPLHAIGIFARSEKYYPTLSRHRLIGALIGAPLVSGVTLFTGYAIGKAYATAISTGRDL